MELRTEEAKIIILSGKARSGKDTSMQIIKKKYESLGKKVICLFYASYIKEYAKRISDWDGNDETKPRTLLQVLGTDIIRNTIDNKFFINRTIEDIKVYSKFFDVIIIGDARFPEEIEDIKKVFSNVVSVHITRKDMNILSYPVIYQAQIQAPREEVFDLDNYKEYDYVINNDGSIEELESKLNEI